MRNKGRSTVVVMDMTTGTILEDEFGDFEDEVLNAGWVPPSPELGLGLQEVQAGDTAKGELDAEHFLGDVYRNQR